MPGSLHTIDMAAASLVAGSRAIVGNATAVKLVTTVTPCKRVWVARQSDSTGKVRIGTAARTARLLDAADEAGFYIHIDDASKIYVWADTDTTLEYWIEN